MSDFIDDPASPSMRLPDFQDLPSAIGRHAADRPGHAALICGERRQSYAELDATMNRVACALQRDGGRVGDTIAICAIGSIEYFGLFMGALRAGLCVAPIAPSSTAEQIAAMVADSGARHFFLDAEVAAAVGAEATPGVRRIRVDGSQGDEALAAWWAGADAAPTPVAIDQDLRFNIIYSSGTTGVPKGIVHTHALRWGQVRRAAMAGYGPEGTTIIATPPYSNTTLVVAIPTLMRGGTLVICPKFDVRGYLEQAQAHRATHTMLVPVQYQRLMAYPEFDRCDLSAFRFKACTSAPFRAELKAELLRRWPGALVEYYGLTEGGGSCILECHLFPDKLHTVGKPAEGQDIRLIDEDGRELPRHPSAVGELVGRSPVMMAGYHNREQQSRDAEWFDSQGRRFLRSGDVGRFDEDGFVVLMDRRKDMLISGGFNIYPSDLEAHLRQHPAVADVAVVGVASAQWGETPVAFVVARPGSGDKGDNGDNGTLPEAIRAWLNARVGKHQRLAGVQLIDELPRSAIGKVLKRELREQWRGSVS